MLYYQVHFPLDILFFFFNDPPTTEIYTLSLHDALPICPSHADRVEERREHQRKGNAHEEGRYHAERSHSPGGAAVALLRLEEGLWRPLSASHGGYSIGSVGRAHALGAR